MSQHVDRHCEEPAIDSPAGDEAIPKREIASASMGTLPRNDGGFTLIELLVVIVILGILVSLAAPRLAGRTESARMEAAHADVEGGIALALDLYEVDLGRYPASLEELVKKPSESSSWKGPYLKRGIPKDPWGNPYLYRFPGTQNQEGYDLYSLGPDKRDGTGDEIANGTSSR